MSNESAEQEVSREQHPTPSDGLYLRFDYANVGYVIDGVEDCTFRYNLNRDVPEGEIIKLLTPKGNVFGYARVEDRYTTNLRHAYTDAVGIDDRHHPAADTLGLLKRLRSHYEDAVLDMESEIGVVYFDVFQIGGAR